MLSWLRQLMRLGYRAEARLEVTLPDGMEVTVRDAPPMTPEDQDLLVAIKQRILATGRVSDEDHAILERMREKYSKAGGADV